MFWPILLLSGLLGYLFLIKLPKRLSLLNKLKAIPGPPSLPILGNAVDLSVHKREVLSVIGRFFQEYGPRFKMFVGMQPYVILANAADAEKILSSQTQIEKSGDYDSLQEWLGLGLLTSKGEKWFQRRKQLTPAFHFKILEDFLRVFNEQCNIFTKVLERKGKLVFDIFPVITLCTLDIICETAMGKSVFAQQKSDSEYVKAIYRISELVQYRQLRPWLHNDFMWRLSSAGKENRKCLKILHGFTDMVIQEKKMERKNGTRKSDETNEDNFVTKKRQAFLDLLLDAQQTDTTLTDQNVREETNTFMFEGHDTTSAAVSWTTFLLSLNPEHQAKVQQELDEIFAGDLEREVTMTDLARMKYLECCIKESLRLFPSAPFVGRKLNMELKLDDGVVLPPGITVWVYIFFLHRDPKVFPDPEKFDPNRFSQEDAEGRNPFSYVPFSAGPRNCIGQKFAMMEEKVLLSSIFRRFRVKAAERLQDVNVLCDVITRPEMGLHVTMKKR
ncbi:Cytochrome P450 4c3 [Orchesella cincta]|uniref:Cytochrome P450 4c3 n=1 Tax=Orchesella cincta TaxID=48709 RepID=A0A1D2ME44_ORCCI|nr:Cytochrome P450 4c3 [Orchesella cincta]